MMQDIMLDIETMGQKAGAAIISIGAVYFDKDTLGEKFYEKISLESCLKVGLKMDASTVIWWLQQSESARNEFKDNDKEKTIAEVLDKFSAYVNINAKVWGNGSDFDNVLVSYAYDRCNKKLPWKYYNNRCFRTLKDKYSRKLEPAKNTEAHNALADAIWQAQYAQNILKYEDTLIVRP